MKQVPQRLAQARYHIELHFPYLATALYSLQWVERPSLNGIVADKRWRIYTSVEYIEQTPIDEIAGGILLEIFRLLRGHSDRAPRFDTPEDAATWALSSMLEVSDDYGALEGVSLPFGSPKPSDFDLKNGELVESYFSGLLEQGITPDFEIVWGSCCDGCPHPWELGENEAIPGLDPVYADLLKENIAKSIDDYQASGRGTVPAGLLRWAKDRLNPKVDWRKLLRRKIGSAYQTAKGAAMDYTFARPSRRSAFSAPFLLPSLISRKIRLAFVIDTSGSMREQDLAQGLAEIDGVLAALGHDNPITVISADAAAHTCENVMSRNKVTLRGGGGTDMGEGIAAAQQLKQKPNIIVVFTDGETPWPSDPPPGIQVIIVICRAEKTSHRMGSMIRQLSGVMDPPRWAAVVRITD